MVALKNRLLSAAAVAGISLGVGLLGAPTIGHATTVTYVQSVQGCSGGCGIDTNNTVQVSDTVSPTSNTLLPGGVFDILVTLDTSTATPWSFQKDPTGNGHQASFVFSSSSNALTLSNITSGFTANASNPASSLKLAPTTWNQSAYGISTGQQQVFSTLDFHVDTHNATETLAQFIATLLKGDDGVSVFGADAFSGNTGNTGTIGFSLQATPLPGALWLFGTVLAGATGISGWRRKKRDGSAVTTA
jgi:hypothetical protein